TLAQRVAGNQLDGGVYLLADSSFAPLAGNLAAWPRRLKGDSGWGNFEAPKRTSGAPRRPLLRATFETLADGSHLLVGKDIGGEACGFAQQTTPALLRA